jgi:DNA repair protein RadD
MLTLRPYQNQAIAAIYRYFESNKGNPLIVIPTAGGKSLVMAAFIEGVLRAWPDQRILIVTHVRELIAQNHAEMLGLWPEAPAGVYSAGLGRREADARILFAGIQSVHRKAAEIGHCDLVLIDEAHLMPVSSATIYRRFLDGLSEINPKLKVIGFTATPYRLDSGMLHEGEAALFTDIAYEVPVRDLIDQGYLCPLVSKQPKTALDVRGVGSRGGEFIASELQAAVDKEVVTRAAVSEIIAYGEDRRSWLAFCAGVEHAQHVAAEFRSRGISCARIFGDTPKEERDRIIAAFKRGEIRALASMGVLTTGFNAPGVDLIAMLRPTKSAGLYVQMAGRGTRLAQDKENCLVLDFAGNVSRHGPIDLVRPKKPGEGGDGTAPTRVCPECESIVAASATECPDCGFVFPPPPVTIAPTASTLAILSDRRDRWLEVTSVTYRRHEKEGSPPSVRVEYHCGLVTHREWVCFEHQGYARLKAEGWWQRRCPSFVPTPRTVEEALNRADALLRPSHILVRSKGRYTEVAQYRFDRCTQPTTASARSAVARPATTAGSTRPTQPPIPGARPAAGGSAADSARTSATGGEA